MRDHLWDWLSGRKAWQIFLIFLWLLLSVGAFMTGLVGGGVSTDKHVNELHDVEYMRSTKGIVLSGRLSYSTCGKYSNPCWAPTWDVAYVPLDSEISFNVTNGTILGYLTNATIKEEYVNDKDDALERVQQFADGEIYTLWVDPTGASPARWSQPDSTRYQTQLIAFWVLAVVALPGCVIYSSIYVHGICGTLNRRKGYSEVLY